MKFYTEEVKGILNKSFTLIDFKFKHIFDDEEEYYFDDNDCICNDDFLMNFCGEVQVLGEYESSDYVSGKAYIIFNGIETMSVDSNFLTIESDK